MSKRNCAGEARPVRVRTSQTVPLSPGQAIAVRQGENPRMRAEYDAMVATGRDRSAK